MPLLTVALVWTNGWHHLVWTSLTPSGPAGAPLVYGHGAWFWLAAAYNYVLLVAGTVVLVAALARMPAPYRSQGAALLLGVALPWLGNALYLSGISVLGGADPTPLAFALTGVVFAAGLFRRRLFDLVPVARHALIESMADGVVVLDAEHRVLDINPSARALLGLSRAPIGERAEVVLAAWPALVALAVGGETTERDAHGETPAGPRELHARITPLRDAGGRWRGRLLVVGDVTERRRTEEALRHSEKLASLGQLLAGVAHELNNPLSVVIGHATLLRRELGTAPGAARVERIAAAAERCARIVTNFLSVARRRARRPTSTGSCARRSRCSPISSSSTTSPCCSTSAPTCRTSAPTTTSSSRWS
jgi:signal transduction histidine kinase